MHRPARASAMGACAIALLLAGCVSMEQKRAAVDRVNAAFKECYEGVIRARGTHHLSLPREQAMTAAARGLESLGMTIVSTDSVTFQYVSAQAPAPAPLDKEEWDRAVEKDLPEFRRLLGEDIPWLLTYFITFEPEGLDVAIYITGENAGGGTDLSATMRMVERKPPESGMPRREYPPCTAVSMGVDKLWRAVDAAAAR